MALNKKTMKRKNRKNKKTKSKRGGKSLRLKQRGGDLTAPGLLGIVVFLIAAIGGTIWSASDEADKKVIKGWKNEDNIWEMIKHRL